MKLKAAGCFPEEDVSLDDLIVTQESLDKSIQQIKSKITSVVNNTSIDFDKAADKGDKLMKQLRSALEDKVDVKKLEKLAEQHGKELADSDIDNEKVQNIQDKNSFIKAMSETHSKSIEGTVKYLENATADWHPEDPFVLLFWTYFIGFCLNVFVGLTIGIIFPPAAMVISGLFIAPILQQYSTKIAIEEDYPMVYTIALSCVETFGRVLTGTLLAGPLGAFVNLIVSIPSVVMHFLTMFLQKMLKDKEGTEEVPTYALLLAIAAHMLFNAFGVAASIISMMAMSGIVSALT